MEFTQLDAKKKGDHKAMDKSTGFPKYSIVTPMYNSFQLIERYFKSLEEQTLNNFEVILVDDCSTDDSYEKACEYAKKTQLKITV